MLQKLKTALKNHQNFNRHPVALSKGTIFAKMMLIFASFYTSEMTGILVLKCAN